MCIACAYLEGKKVETITPHELQQGFAGNRNGLPADASLKVSLWRQLLDLDPSFILDKFVANCYCIYSKLQGISDSLHLPAWSVKNAFDLLRKCSRMLYKPLQLRCVYDAPPPLMISFLKYSRIGSWLICPDASSGKSLLNRRYLCLLL